MFYKSTRNDNIRVSASQAIAQGISEEGGLFVPEFIPYIKDNFAKLAEMDYRSLAKEILSLYLSDYTAEEIEDCVDQAYAPEKFEGGEPVKVVSTDQNRHILELWHGPTCAFKDMALQLLPHLLTKAMKKKYDGKKAVILVATSGDTGKAALEGFKNVPGTQIIVFYPDNGVSPMQLRQMNTQDGENVTVCGVAGNFDDCQTQVKRIFTDASIKEQLSSKNMLFSSANSINWGRLLPQIVYYFYAYFQLYRDGILGDFQQKIAVDVPTGNFGNILAAYYAMRMGLPIEKLICASNSNNVLTEFINTGVYDKNREFFTTISPSMDILVSSNLERLLYHLSGESSEKLRAWMTSLGQEGKYQVDAETLDRVRSLFYGGFCTDSETTATIRKTFTEQGYLADTHTAVALKVYDDYLSGGGNAQLPCVIASTANPYKFTRSVMAAISDFTCEDEFEMADKMSELTGVKIPKPLANLKGKQVRFQSKCTRETISDFVLETIGIK